MSQTPRIILVRPQMGENIGAAARAMLNFGFGDMALVSPRDGWPNARATTMASGATPVLEAARVSGSIAEAAEGVDYLFATTARTRDMVKPVFEPEAAMAEARRMIGEGRRVGILFGPERAGLENDDVAQANAVVTVPVNPDFPSLNLAQCVLLLGYEWRRGSVEATPQEAPDLADNAAVDRWAAHWNDRLDTAGFFHPPEKAAHLRRSFRNLWSRMPLSGLDVQMLHGALRQLVRPKDDL